MNALDACVRHWTAHERNVLQAGETDVGHILATPAQEAIVLLARQTRANPLG